MSRSGERGPASPAGRPATRSETHKKPPARRGWGCRSGFVSFSDDDALAVFVNDLHQAAGLSAVGEKADLPDLCAAKIDGIAGNVAMSSLFGR